MSGKRRSHAAAKIADRVRRSQKEANRRPAEPEESPTIAPGQYLGFSLQASRMLDYLLRGRQGVVVSLEVIGDVAVKEPGGSILVEELKSRTSDSNPVADRSVDFWKTMANWSRDVSTGRLDPNATRFHLYVTQPFASNLAATFSAAASEADAREAVRQARGGLLEGDGQVTAQSALRRHLDAVFDSDPAQLIRIIQNFHMEFGRGTSWADLLTTVGSTFVPPDCAEDVLRGMSGWLAQQIHGRIEQHLPAEVNWDSFRTAILTLIRRFDRARLLSSGAPKPNPGELEAEMRVRTYVRQLDLIGANYDDRVRAVTDFLRAASARVEWARQGVVLEDSLQDFEEELISSWTNYRRRCEIAHANLSGDRRGQLLYSDCYQHHARIEQADPPEFFCRGSFHKLADAKVIGWHPDYAEMLESGANSA